jgi:hypothetical protein
VEKKPKLPKVTESVAKRVRKADYQVSRHGTCIICGKGWDDCPHSIDQAYKVIQAVQLAEMLGIPFAGK